MTHTCILLKIFERFFMERSRPTIDCTVGLHSSSIVVIYTISITYDKHVAKRGQNTDWTSRLSFHSQLPMAISWIWHAKHLKNTLNPYNTELFLFKPWRLKGFFFNFKSSQMCWLVISGFIWIPMLWVYDHYKYFNSFSAGIVFTRLNLTSVDVRFWPLKTIHALKGLSCSTGNHHPLVLMARYILTTENKAI